MDSTTENGDEIDSTDDSASSGECEYSVMDDYERIEVPNPRAKSNIFSSITYLWTLPIFKTAFGRDLETSDLYTPLNEHSSGRLGDTFSQYWKNELLSGKPSVFRVIYNCFKWQILLYFFLTLIVDCGIRICQPIILGKFIQYFSHSSTDKPMSSSELYLYGFALIMSCFLTIIMSQSISMGLVHIGLKIKIGCSSLIYRKSLRLSKSTLEDTTVGFISNLLTNDVTRLEILISLMNYLVIGPLHTIVITVCLWYYIGVSSLVGVGILLLMIPLSIWLGVKSTQCRKKATFKTDERIQKTSEVISGIKAIKMFAWEDVFMNIINKLRNKEMKSIGGTNYIRGAIVSLDMLLTRLSLFASILCYVLLDNTVTAERVFVVVSFYGLLKQSMTVFFPRAIVLLADFRVSIKRLQSYMLYEESNKPTVDRHSNRQHIPIIKEEKVNAYDNVDETTVPLHVGNNVREIRINVSRDNLDDSSATKAIAHDINDPDNPRFKNTNALCLEQVFAKWNQQSSEFVINNVSLTIKNGSFAAVIGEVGSGKSTLLHIILQELPVSSGLVDVFGDVSYASQEPWLFNGSIKKNILFGSKMDKMRYKSVIDSCALKRDLMTTANGDKYMVQEFGANLSGGQRVRINLARAVYRNVDIYLLDDLLSAVDVHVGQQLFSSCFTKFLHGRTRVLVTNQTQNLKDVDHIILMRNGAIASEGTYEYLQENSKQFRDFLSLETAKEIKPNEKVLIKKKEEKMMVRLTSNASEGSADDLPNYKKQKAETVGAGAVQGYVYRAYFMASGSILFVIGVLFLAIASQILASTTDYWTSYWVNREEKYSEYCRNVPIRLNNATALELQGIIENMLSTNISGTKSLLDFTTEISNMNTGADTFMINGQGPNIDNTSSHSGFCCEEMDHGWFLKIYGILTVTLIVIVLLRSFSFFWTALRASLNLHYNMLEAIMKAQIRFFSLNPSGRILNRFSKDMGAIDDVLPQKIMDALHNGLQVIGTLIIAVYINYWLIFAVMFSVGLFIVLRMYYIPTSRSIYRLLGTTRSPGLTHTSASLKGITTIRAYGNQRLLEKEFDYLQSTHSSACYLNLATGRAFALWADSVCLLFLIITTWSFLMSGEGTMGGNVGLLLSQIIGLTMMLQYGLRMSSEVENEMISVERVLDYTDIELEPPSIEMKDYQLPTFWPPYGEIKFNNVWVRYSPTRAPAVCDLDFLILPKQRIGIVGRTGAGKSSIINALFRLPFMDGYIEIDGVRTDTLGLQVLRSKISVIPQEPMLFSGTIRGNLDPYNAYTDDEIWKALDKVEMKERISDYGGINAHVSENGKNFSVGQRQLLCLARALLKQNRILVLDEATANVDQRTDDLIQNTIRTEFKDCTVLMIAHRMDIVIDSDKVLVMDGGRRVEYDHAHILLQNDSFFTSMVAKTGPEKEQMLRSIAKKNYEKIITEGNMELPPVQCV